MKPRMNFYQAGARHHEGDDGAGKPAGERPRAVADGAGQDPRLADQRLRLLHRHAHAGRPQAGETEQRLYLLDAWRESPLYTDRERAALAWTEAVTLVCRDPRARRRLRGGPRAFLGSRDRQADLLIATINAWNRLAISFRAITAGEGQRRDRGLIKSRWRARNRYRFRAGGWSSAPVCRWPPACRRWSPRPGRSRRAGDECLLRLQGFVDRDARSSTRSWRSSASFTTALRVQPGKISLPFDG